MKPITCAVLALFWTASAHADEPSKRAIVHLETDDDFETLSCRVGSGWLRSKSTTWDGRVIEVGKPRYRSIWEDVCRTPCDVPVSIQQTYRIEGEGVTPSRPFVLEAGTNIIHVHHGSLGAWNAGVMMTLAGAALAVTGTTFAALSTLPYDDQSEADRAHTKNTFLTTGLSLAGAGVLALAIGIPLLVTNVTRVGIHHEPQIARRSWGVAANGLFF